MGAEAMAADSWLYLLQGLDGSSPAGPAVLEGPLQSTLLWCLCDSAVMRPCPTDEAASCSL